MSETVNEKALKTLCKVTGLPNGLFNETSLRVKGGLTQIVYDCPAESDEYEVLINPKQEVIQIKNAYTTWEREMITLLCKEKDELAAQATAAATQPQVAPIGTIAPAQPTYNMPPQIQIAALNFSSVAQYIADFVQLNPGCIYSLFDPNNPSCVNEAACHNAQAWEFSTLENIENYLTNVKVYRFDFRPNCGDSSIDQQVAAFVDVDPQTMNIISVNIEG